MATIENVTDTFQVEYRDDGIIVYRILDNDRQTVDALIEYGEQQADEYRESGKHLRRIMDFRESGPPGPYAISKGRDIIKKSGSTLRYSTATLISGKNVLMGLAKSAMGMMSGETKSSTRVFTDEEEALNWLQERLESMGE